MAATVPSQAQIVIIGGGIVGCSVQEPFLIPAINKKSRKSNRYNLSPAEKSSLKKN